MVHFYRNVFTKVPAKLMRDVADMLLVPVRKVSQRPVRKLGVVERLHEMKLRDAARIVEDGIEGTFAYYHFPAQHRVRIRTNNRLERLMKESRRRTRVVGSFPDGQSALMLVAARLRYVVSKTWGGRVYLNMQLLNEIDRNVASTSKDLEPTTEAISRKIRDAIASLPMALNTDLRGHGRDFPCSGRNSH